MAVLKIKDNGTIKTVKSVKLSGGSDEWEPQEDWWDIDSILANDTEEYVGKMICLLKDNMETIKLYDIARTGVQKVKTSDGAEYTSFNSNTEHTWDTSKDKICADGYKTRYIIFYWSSTANWGNQSFNELMHSLYVIFKGMEIQSAHSWYQTGAFGYFCECLKFINCSYISSEFRTIQNLPKLELINTSFPNITDMENSFQYKRMSDENIRAIYENMANNNITKYINTFLNCYNLRSIILKNMSNCQNCSGIFSNCYNLKEVTNLNTTNSTNLNNAFLNCCDLSTFNNCTFDLENCTVAVSMFDSCYSLKNINIYNTGNVQNMQKMFYFDISLVSIEELNFNSCTNANNMFTSAKCLTSINTVSNIKVNGLNFNDCISLNHDTLIRILNALYDYSGDSDTHTITLGSTNLVKLTQAEIAIGTDKNWTIS